MRTVTVRTLQSVYVFLLLDQATYSRSYLHLCSTSSIDSLFTNRKVLSRLIKQQVSVKTIVEKTQCYELLFVSKLCWEALVVNHPTSCVHHLFQHCTYIIQTVEWFKTSASKLEHRGKRKCFSLCSWHNNVVFLTDMAQTKWMTKAYHTTAILRGWSVI